LKIEEKVNYFVCPDECARISSEDALENDFKCPECGNILNHQDNDKTIKFLRNKVRELKMTNGFAKMDGQKKIIAN